MWPALFNLVFKPMGSDCGQRPTAPAISTIIQLRSHNSATFGDFMTRETSMISWKLRSFILAICLCFSASGALATDAIVKRRATLRSDPSTQRPPILTLKPQEDVELIELTPREGYYHVRTSEGEEGWVYSRNLEIVAATPVTPGPVPVPPPGPVPLASGGVASSIPATWERPTPNRTTFHGPDGDCGPTGDGGD